MSSSAQKDIAKIKIGVKQLGICDDDGCDETGHLSTYRQMLKKLTGKTSVGMKVMNYSDRSKVLAHLRKLGFRATNPRPRTKAPGMASQAEVNLIYVLWAALGNNGALTTTGRTALCSWVKNNTKKYNHSAGYNSPEFLPAEAVGPLIEQLKKWCARLKIEWRN